jgi:tRNA pseudouridine38-40 synthase
VANFKTDLDSITDSKYRDALNSYLPADIRVINSRKVPEDFNAKSSARLRVYAYYLYIAAVGYPHLRRSCWKLRRAPAVDTLNRMAGQMIGERDFSAFSAAGDSSKSKIRRVVSAGFYPQGAFLVFRIGASSFLWKMVRSVLGTMIELERDGLAAEAFAAIVQSGERSRVGATAPARGLFLERVVYDDETYPC